VTGNASFGLGNNRLSLSGDAVMTGASTFGAGSDTVQLAGTSSLTGNIDFGGGGDVLTLAGASRFSGSLANSGGLAVTAGAGTTLGVTNLGVVNLASLTTGAGATLGVTLDQGSNTFTSFNIAGVADFAAGTKIDVTLLSLGGVTGSYKIIQAGTLTGAGNLTSGIDSLPFLFATSLDTATAGEVSLVVRQKTAAELGLNLSEAGIVNAVIASADSDAPVANLFLGAQDGEALRSALQQMLPEHAGGAFETVTRGSRLAADILGERGPSLQDRGGWGMWAQQVAWGTSKSIGDTSSYDLTGWGAAAGFERNLGGAGSVGLSLSYLTGKDNSGNNSLMSSQYEGGVYWRGGAGPLRAFARAAVGYVDFDGRRTLVSDDLTRETEGDWSGTLYSLVAGASYEARFGRIVLRPSARVEHFNLDEKSYQEEGGGDAFDLAVQGRKSDETAAVGMVSLGYDFLSIDPKEPWLRLEIEGGRREILSGKLGATTASFAGGQPFTLTPEDRTSGWRAGLRLSGGGPSLGLAAEINGEEQQGEASIGGRIGVQFAL
jgi:outer membrane autotransporter protein